MSMKNILLSGFADEIGESFDFQLESLREFGLSYLELRSADGVNVADFTDEKLKEVKTKLHTAGVKVSSIGSPIGKIAITEDFAPHLLKLKRVMEISRELEAPFIRMFSFYYPKEEGAEKYREETFSRMEQMVDLAQKEDLVLLHENEKGIYGDTALRCKELMERFYCPNFQAVFDFANFVECSVDTLSAYELLKPYVKYIHVKDALQKEKKVVPPGQGDGHLYEILKGFSDCGYEGFLSLEPHLTNFSGLQSLEQGARKREAELTGKAAFHLALSSLQGILEKIA